MLCFLLSQTLGITAYINQPTLESNNFRMFVLAKICLITFQIHFSLVHIILCMLFVVLKNSSKQTLYIQVCMKSCIRCVTSTLVAPACM